MERAELFVNTPHPALQITTHYTCLVDQTQIDQQKDIDLQIYTDGSRIEGKVGAALSVWKGNREINRLKLKLADHCTVYQAELLALNKASMVALDRSERRIGIYSDSRAAIEVVCNGTNTNKLAIATRKNLAAALTQSRAIVLFWVKAHVGLRGNERADELAKEAALRTKTRPNYDLCPISFAKRQIRLDTLREWDQRYREGDTGAITKTYLPDVYTAHRLIKRTTLSKDLTQVLTGHGGFSEYLYRFKCKESPSCVCDTQEKESVFHIIIDCPIFAGDRLDLEHKTGIEIKVQNACELLMNKKNKEDFVKYALKIVRIVNKRNSN